MAPSHPIKKCLKCERDFVALPWEVRRGKGVWCSKGCANSAKVGMKRSHESRKRMSLARIGKYGGEKHPNWQGGVSTAKHIMRNSTAWKNWREAVFKRDGYRCFDCGEKGYIEPHHIVPLKENIRLAFDTKNGITLCRPCHVLTMGKELQLARTYYSLVQAHL